MKIICKNYHKYIRMYLDQRNEKKVWILFKIRAESKNWKKKSQTERVKLIKKKYRKIDKEKTFQKILRRI